MVSIIFPYHVLDDCEDQPLLSVFKKAEVEIRPEPDQEKWRLKVVAATSGIRFLAKPLDRFIALYLSYGHIDRLKLITWSLTMVVRLCLQ